MPSSPSPRLTSQTMPLSTERKLFQNKGWALCGPLFALAFLAGDVVRGALATGTLPLPSAPAEAFARYALQNGSASLGVAICQGVSALALLAFSLHVSARVLPASRQGGKLKSFASEAGAVAAGLLLICAVLGAVLVAVAGTGNLGVINVLRQANFLAGGTLHVAALGVFIGGTSLLARRTKSLPRALVWLGLVQGALAVLSLLSLGIYYANAFILFARLLGFIWCIAAGLVLVLRREPAPSDDF